MLRLHLREVKMALLEADVNFKVVKQFVKAVQERATPEKTYSIVLRPDRPLLNM